MAAMKALILMRHAKSSWGTPDLGDHDRPLNGRGKAAAPVMARWLAAQGLLPQVILASSAKRVQQTVKHMRKVVPDLPAPVVLPALYHAAPAAILEAVRQAPPETGTVMVVGHEPALSAAAWQLSDPAPPAQCRAAFGHFPTAAMAVFELEIAGWKDLSWGRARFAAFTKPRDLMEPPASG